MSDFISYLSVKDNELTYPPLKELIYADYLYLIGYTLRMGNNPLVFRSQCDMDSTLFLDSAEQDVVIKEMLKHAETFEFSDDQKQDSAIVNL